MRVVLKLTKTSKNLAHGKQPGLLWQTISGTTIRIFGSDFPFGPPGPIQYTPSHLSIRQTAFFPLQFFLARIACVYPAATGKAAILPTTARLSASRFVTRIPS